MDHVSTANINMCINSEKPETEGAFDRLFAGKRKIISIITDHIMVFQYENALFITVLIFQNN